MFHWIHHLFNPHCTQCEELRLDSHICKGCEILRHQLEIANLQIDKLVNKITEKPEPVIINNQPPVLTMPKTIPWAVRKQMLEAEDRAKAQSMRNAALPDSQKTDVTELEKELNLATTVRESSSSGA